MDNPSNQHLSSLRQFKHDLFLFAHITRMEDNAEATEILTASTLTNWKRYPQIIRIKIAPDDFKSHYLTMTEQLKRLRTDHSEGGSQVVGATC